MLFMFLMLYIFVLYTLHNLTVFMFSVFSDLISLYDVDYILRENLYKGIYFDVYW